MKRHSTVSAIRFQLASQSTDLQSGHSNMDNGKASPSCCCCSSSWLSAQCGSNAMSRISKGCCRANRGRETRTNCILTHANCQCPHLPTPLSPFACVLLRRASLLHYSGQVRDGRMDGWTTVAYGPQLPLCTLPTDVECVGS